jgi:hypothetical protein
MSDSVSTGDSSTSKSLLWMTVALFAGFGVLLGGGLFMASHLVRSLGLAAATGKNTLRTPSGGFRMEKENQIGPGLPVYPRSSLEVPGNDATSQILQDAKDGLATVTYVSTDDRDAVEAWYVEHLSPEYTRHAADEQPFAAPFQDVHVSAGDIAFLAERGDQIRVVDLTTDAAGTTIHLVRAHAQTSPTNSSETSSQGATNSEGATNSDATTK